MDKIHITQQLNMFLATASLIGFVVISCWLIYLLLQRNTKSPLRYPLSLLKTSAHPLIAFTALLSIFLTLFYSEYLLFVPCWLCWWQRILSYPIFCMALMGWYKKDSNFFDYVLSLSIPGLVIALYHEYLQLGYSPFIPCSALPGAADCAKPVFIEYGFVTFPFMSVVLFMFFIAIASTAKRGTTTK